MSEYVEIVALVEGKTEQIFILDLISPYLASKQIFITPVQISNNEWPGLTEAKGKKTPAAKAAQVNAATKSMVRAST